MSACECEAGGRVGSGGSSERPHGSPLWGHTETNLPAPSFLHPNAGKKSKYKTSVRKKTLNPEFNEVGWPDRRQSWLLGEGSWHPISHSAGPSRPGPLAYVCS